MAAITNLPLEGDGCIETLFYYLWCKDEFDNGPRLQIPDTIIYKYTQPAAWYFTSVNGQIKRKSKVNLVNVKIELEFTRKAAGCDIVAYYIFCQNGNTTIEYLDEEGLRDFLYKREKVNNGILQRFIEPKGSSNSLIRSIWSPKICLIERKVNVRKLFDRRYGLYERAVTFDGAEVHSRTDPIRGSIISADIQGVCETVVDHIAEVTFHKHHINRMALNLKVDAQDRIWLLWCSSLRLEPKNNVSAVFKNSKGYNQMSFHHNLPNNTHTNRAQSMLQGLGSSSSSPSLDGKSSSTSHLAYSNSVSALPMSIESGISIPSYVQLQSVKNVVASGTNRSAQSLLCLSCARETEKKKICHVNYKAVISHFDQLVQHLIQKHHERAERASSSSTYRKENPQITFTWPPEKKMIQVGGNVGFGIIPHIDRDKRAHVNINNATTKDCSSPTKNMKEQLAFSLRTPKEDLFIPPIIQYLHPNLGLDDYLRYKKDPMFLYKRSNVCEDCFLVYADYNTSDLESNSLHQNVPKILQPSRNHSLSQLHTGRHSEVDGKGLKPIAKKLPSSAWKPIPYKDKSRSMHSSNNTQINRHGIHMEFNSSIPTVPKRIDVDSVLSASSSNSLSSKQVDIVAKRLEVDSDAQVIQAEFEVAKNALSHLNSSQEYGYEAKSSESSDRPTTTANGHKTRAFSAGKGYSNGCTVGGDLMDSEGHPELPLYLQEKEEEFFKELYVNPNLDKNHPLSHMIETAARLQKATIPNGSTNGLSAVVAPLSSLTISQQQQQQHQQLPSLKNRYVPRNNDVVHNSRKLKGVEDKPTKNPYSVVQKLPVGTKTGDNRAKRKKKEANETRTSSTVYGTLVKKKASSPLENVNIDDITQSAVKHREFLLQTLQDVRDQLSNPVQLETLVEGKTVASNEPKPDHISEKTNRLEVCKNATGTECEDSVAGTHVVHELGPSFSTVDGMKNKEDGMEEKGISISPENVHSNEWEKQAFGPETKDQLQGEELAKPVIDANGDPCSLDMVSSEVSTNDEPPSSRCTSSQVEQESQSTQDLSDSCDAETFLKKYEQEEPFIDTSLHWDQVDEMNGSVSISTPFLDESSTSMNNECEFSPFDTGTKSPGF